MKLWLLLLSLTGLLLVGCSDSSGILSNGERAEAVGLCKTLAKLQPELSQINNDEAVFLNQLNGWIGQAVLFGVSYTHESNQYVTEARSFAKQVPNFKQKVQNLRQGLETEPLKAAGTQIVRSNVIESLARSEQFYSQTETLLNQIANDFPNTKFFTYPESVSRLRTLIQNYNKLGDAITPAIKDLRVKFNITDDELKR